MGERNRPRARRSALAADDLPVIAAGNDDGLRLGVPVERIVVALGTPAKCGRAANSLHPEQRDGAAAQRAA